MARLNNGGHLGLRCSISWHSPLAVALVVGLAVFGCDSSVTGVMSPSESMTSIGNNQPTANAGGMSGSSPAGDGGASVGGALGAGAGGTSPAGSGSGVGSGGTGPTTPTSCDSVYAAALDPASLCRFPVQTAEPLPGRVLPVVQTSITQTVSLQRIFDQFKSACGRCHGPGQTPGRSNGEWVIGTVGDMFNDPEKRLGQPALTRILSKNPDEVMPPGRDLSERPDPPASAKELAELLAAWVAEGRKVEGFRRSVQVSPETPYRYSDELRDRMTNIGDCIPATELVGCDSAEMKRLDAKFAAMQGFADLPKHLEETDLDTLDSSRLAERRVLSYAPTYTLFSDGAKKMRYVRVPEGQAIRFDPQTNDLDIPDNTRFYKTFLRRIVDKRGRVSHRKIETRIIVARKDGVEGGRAVTRAIFGTYLWSLDEARAELTELPYNDQTPFRDVALRHVLDEFRATDPVERGLSPALDPDTFDGIDAAAAEDDALRAQNPSRWYEDDELLTRGYAVPGRDRCIQCHMGSSSQSFILGFNPYQVERRAGGAGGVFDDHPADEDELSQLRRFVQYGLFTNVPEAHTPVGADPSEPEVAFALEESQGARQARNEYELKAQGYMLGNCAFCHNPRGFPTVENPVLRDLLSFFPSPTDDKRGIFQFPLERVSPRTSRTESYTARFPYITPSLFERDPSGASLFKFFQVPGQPSTLVYVAAPWRSLLYKNVQTPFTYESDAAIHPHMPLNVAGYDVRAARIMGDWMLSVPARLKPRAENTNEWYWAGGATGREQWPADGGEQEQPWLEVPASDPDYAAYVEAAALRRSAFHAASLREFTAHNASCPPSIPARDCVDGYPAAGERRAYLGGADFMPDTSEVFAPEMAGSAALEQPRDELFSIVPSGGEGPALITQDAGALTAAERARSGQWRDFIPDRANWISRDLTLLPGAWTPRRSTWETAFSSLEAFMPPTPDLSSLTEIARLAAQAAQEVRRTNARRVFELLQTFTLSDALKRFATEEFAYGIWKSPEGGQTSATEVERCPSAVAAAKSVRDSAASPPLWFRDAGIDPAEDGDQLVYAARPGQIMFTLICSNCHGQAADGRSLLAGTILELTGGRTRVANLRDGLFGGAGQGRLAVFGGKSVDAETLAVRYLAWMGLGGTEAKIPKVVLNRVGATRPLGEDRHTNPNAQPTANMLDNAVGFCKDSLALGMHADPDGTLGPSFAEFDDDEHDTSALVAVNGDAELWVRLCGLDNPGPIRVMSFNPGDIRHRFSVVQAYWRDIDGVAQYAATDRFGDQRGHVSAGLAPDNVFPWCIRDPRRRGHAAEPAEAAKLAELRAAWSSLPGQSGEPPLCPDSLFLGEGTGLSLLRVAPLDQEDRRRDLWATRGAMNVGASVFLYQDALSKGTTVPKPPFDACALPAAASR